MSEETPPKAEAPSLPPAPTAEELNKAEGLLRQANLARVRGQADMAERLMEEARVVAPGSGAVLEAIGDELSDRKQGRKAMELYKQAMAVEPNRISVERKYAELVLRNSIIADPFAMSGPDSGTMASAKMGFWLSAIVPGLGQIVSNQVGKGMSMMVGASVCFAWLLITLDNHPAKIRGLMSLLHPKLNIPLDPTALPILFVGLAFYLWSLFDAASHAKRWTPTKIDRPIPPSDRSIDI